MLRQLLDRVDVDERVVRNFQIAKLCRDFQNVLHAAARDGDLAAKLVRHGQKALQPEGVGRERRDDDALAAAGELALEALGDLFLRRRIAGPLDIRRVAEEGEDALAAQLAEARQVDHAVFGHCVDLEVAGHDHHAHRRLDCEGDRVGNRVVHVDELHLEAAGLDRLARLMGVELDDAVEMVLLQLQLYQPRRQARGVDGALELLHRIGDAADVILVPMRQEHAPDAVLILDQIGHVRDHEVDAVHIVLRKAESAVDNDDVLAVFQHSHVLADLIQTAEGNDFQFFCQIKFTLFLNNIWITDVRLAKRLVCLSKRSIARTQDLRNGLPKGQQKPLHTAAPAPAPSRRRLITAACIDHRFFCVWRCRRTVSFRGRVIALSSAPEGASSQNNYRMAILLEV